MTLWCCSLCSVDLTISKIRESVFHSKSALQPLQCVGKTQMEMHMKIKNRFLLYQWHDSTYISMYVLYIPKMKTSSRLPLCCSPLVLISDSTGLEELFYTYTEQGLQVRWRVDFQSITISSQTNINKQRRKQRTNDKGSVKIKLYLRSISPESSVVFLPISKRSVLPL